MAAKGSTLTEEEKRKTAAEPTNAAAVATPVAEAKKTTETVLEEIERGLTSLAELEIKTLAQRHDILMTQAGLFQLYGIVPAEAKRPGEHKDEAAIRSHYASIIQGLKTIQRDLLYQDALMAEYDAKKTPEEVLEIYHRALLDKPGDTTLLIARGKLLTRLKRYQEAATDCNTLLALEPHHPAAKDLLKKIDQERNQAFYDNFATILRDRIIPIFSQHGQCVLKDPAIRLPFAWDIQRAMITGEPAAVRLYSPTLIKPIELEIRLSKENVIVPTVSVVLVMESFRHNTLLRTCASENGPHHGDVTDAYNFSVSLRGFLFAPTAEEKAKAAWIPDEKEKPKKPAKKLLIDTLPSNIKPLIQRATEQMQKDRYKDALKTLRQALAIEPNHFFALYLIGSIYDTFHREDLQQGRSPQKNLETAKDFLTRSAAQEFPSAIGGLLMVHRLLGEHDQAEARYQELAKRLAADPTIAQNSNLHMNMTSYLTVCHRISEAIRCAQEGLAQFPECPHLKHQLKQLIGQTSHTPLAAVGAAGPGLVAS